MGSELSDFGIIFCSGWGGLDTLVVSAGVSALRPLLEVAGLERQQGAFVPPHASVEGVTHTVEVATAAMRGNFLGPLVSAVTFVRSLISHQPSHLTSAVLDPASICNFMCARNLPDILPRGVMPRADT